MYVMSVNVGSPRTIDIAGKPETTGIHKTARTAPVPVGPLGLAGDHVADTEHHGGVDQAVYVYSALDYDWWAQRLGGTLEPGVFGENLTVAGLDTADVRIGDRLRIGAVLLEVTAPRIPCATLAARMNDLAFVRTFREARRPGFYTRVLHEGEIRAGDPVTFERAGAVHPTVNDLFEAWFGASPDADLLRRALAAPVAVRARPWYEEQLARAERARTEPTSARSHTPGGS